MPTSNMLPLTSANNFPQVLLLSFFSYCLFFCHRQIICGWVSFLNNFYCTSFEISTNNPTDIFKLLFLIRVGLKLPLCNLTALQMSQLCWQLLHLKLSTEDQKFWNVLGDLVLCFVNPAVFELLKGRSCYSNLIS